MPPLLLVQRWLGLRTHDDPPTAGEIAAHLIGWSILFEIIGPHIMRTTGDPWDVAAYSFGAAISFLCWRVLKWNGSRSASGFDWLAPSYRSIEWLLAGQKLQRCRAAFLPLVSAPRRALLVGEGHGQFLAQLLQQHPHVRCLCLDSSPRMLEVARQRIIAKTSTIGQIEFLQADLTTWVPSPNSFDLIVTQFVFDCFTDQRLAPIVHHLANAATADARWLVADFAQPQKGPARWRAKAILAVMYLFFRWATGIVASKLPAIDAAMRQQGFVLRERRISEWGLLQSDLWMRLSPNPS